MRQPLVRRPRLRWPDQLVEQRSVAQTHRRPLHEFAQARRVAARQCRLAVADDEILVLQPRREPARLLVAFALLTAVLLHDVEHVDLPVDHAIERSQQRLRFLVLGLEDRQRVDQCLDRRHEVFLRLLANAVVARLRRIDAHVPQPLHPFVVLVELLRVRPRAVEQHDRRRHLVARHRREIDRILVRVEHRRVRCDVDLVAQHFVEAAVHRLDARIGHREPQQARGAERMPPLLRMLQHDELRLGAHRLHEPAEAHRHGPHAAVAQRASGRFCGVQGARHSRDRAHDRQRQVHGSDRAVRRADMRRCDSNEDRGRQSAARSVSCAA